MIRFEVRATAAGFHAVIVAGNNEKVFWTETYTTAYNAIEAFSILPGVGFASSDPIDMSALKSGAVGMETPDGIIELRWVDERL